MITRGCIRCKCSFNYEGQLGVGRGKMTRKYCNECKVLQHRDESRLYQRKRNAMYEMWLWNGQDDSMPPDMSQLWCSSRL